MGTIIKLLLTFLIALACWRAGNVYFKNYKFNDEVQRTAQFGASKSDGELQAIVAAAAKRLDVPVQPEYVVISRETNRIKINVVYIEKIEILPTVFYPWEFRVNADALTFEGLAPVQH